ncbi:class I SAM-dependent methyltransferase [Actinopolymorpha alba]|uniref:class I SAM-dependent methyltransferase n=1 Tax=Actinopolymorpha alba TaxID=533267 RepID=UPI001ED9C014|nr:class I SAM-dependent methyltransferase [Actinopolymorpha alba]
MDEHTAVNQRLWDELAPLHEASRYYDVASFQKGSSTLGALEVNEVGDVSDRRLLHLMCHIGLDTLSWAHRGAKVTGADFSSEAIRIARDLAGRIGTDAEFVRVDVREAAEGFDEPFDIVFLSRGVLMWIEDIPAWAQTCARLLRPGGVFYVLDIHPVALAISPTEGGQLVQHGPYFHVPQRPTVVRKDGSYAVSDAGMTNQESREWSHSLGDIVTALVRAGIRIEFLHEFAADDQPTDDSVPVDHSGRHQLPAHFSIRGIRD